MNLRNTAILAAASLCGCLLISSCDMIGDYMDDKDPDLQTGTDSIELGGINSFPCEGAVLSIVTDNKGNIYAAGELFVARWDKASGTWTKIGGDNNPTFNVGIRYPLAIDKDGTLYARALKQEPLYNATSHVAKWDGSPDQWTEVGTGLSFNNGLTAISTDPYGNVYAAGNNLGSSGAYLVQQWEKNTVSWKTLVNAPNGPVFSLASDKDGLIYAGGDFVNQNFSPYISVWNGASWNELGGANSANFKTGEIKVVNIDSAGNVYAGGYYSNGQQIDNIAVWNKVTGTWGFTDPIPHDGAYWVNSLVSDTEGNIYAGGDFTMDKGFAVAKWNGSSWVNFGMLDANGSINALCFDSEGNLYVGGGFTNKDGRSFIAVIPK
jgi:hypothetical protein